MYYVSSVGAVLPVYEHGISTEVKELPKVSVLSLVESHKSLSWTIPDNDD